MSSVESSSLAHSRFYALFLGSLFYGCYIITFICTIEVLLLTRGKPKHIRKVNVPVLVGTTSLFLMSSGNVALSFYRSFPVSVPSMLQNREKLEKNQAPERLNVVETFFVLFGTIAGDWILIHRCWILWNKAWKWVIVPFTLWVGCIACAIAAIVFQTSVAEKRTFSPGAFPYAVGFWLASILINISSTVLTIARLWLIEKENRESGLQPVHDEGYPRSTLQFIICITVETGLLFTLSAVATFATYVIRKNSFYVLSAIELPIIGSACNLMIIRGNRRRKRLLKIKLKRTIGYGSDLSRLGAPGIGSEATRSTERTTELGTTRAVNSPTSVWSHTEPNDEIEELPYP